MQHLCQGAVAQQARGEGNLQPEPVLGLADIKDVSWSRRDDGQFEFILTMESGAWRMRTLCRPCKPVSPRSPPSPPGRRQSPRST